MPERARALHALAGRTFPRRGDFGTYYRGDRTALVLVTDMAVDGSTVTVRFVGSAAVKEFGAFRVLTRISDAGNGCYGPSEHEVHSEWAFFRPAGRDDQ
jgi:hypothetical protein